MTSETSRQLREAARLEQLWEGAFGDGYVERNAEAGDRRGAFWATILAGRQIRNVLEVGCNVGANLRWIVEHVDPRSVYGVDVNLAAVRRLRGRLPDVNAIATSARELPFRDKWFDLAFTTGVLIHQPEATLPIVMSEVVRVSRRYILCGEYYAEQAVAVPYRGENDALFKRNYGRLYLEAFPELELLGEGFLGESDGWDNIHWWLFERT